MNKKVLLVIGSEKFQEQEYQHTKQELEAAGIQIITVSDKPGTAVGYFGLQVKVDLVLDQVQTKDCDGLCIIGGAGAMLFLDNALMYKILNELFALQKVVGAICIAPRILAHAEILRGKKATCWDGDGRAFDIFKEHGVLFVPEAVVIDDHVITADGPEAAHAFGKAIVSVI